MRPIASVQIGAEQGGGGVFSSSSSFSKFRMGPRSRKFCWLALAFALVLGTASAAPIRLNVRLDAPGAHINPAMWGIFFEDINFGADGGLYAELVKNRGFEFPDPLTGWSKLTPGAAQGILQLRDENPFNQANPHYLRIESEGRGLFGVANEGFRGMGVRQGESYRFTAQVRRVAGAPRVRVELYSAEGLLLDTVELKGASSDWQKLSAELRPAATDAHAKLYLLLDGKGSVDVDMVSLFPANTWKNRPAGLRADLVQMLAELKPGFMRFPGGCIVEGTDLSRRYQWKKTLGPIEERPVLIDRWNYEFLHRPAPDYYQSFGLGFFEFFQLCEDIGAQPMPILNCGMACQFNTGELCPVDQLDSYIQDALDLIEFANGQVSSTWGERRAALGHPEPFHMKLLGVGNEQWGEVYIERFARFRQALKAKYPDVQLIASVGPSPDDERFRFAWPKLRALSADIVDEHCYARPEWFFDNTHRYDDYPRTGPKVFMGEYAAQSDKTVSVKNRNNLECALAEAAYMTGLERNADVVTMASYAPLFAHVDAWQWRPDLIWTDNLRVYGTPNYYVQQLFSRNRGDVVLPARLTCDDPKAVTNLYVSATQDDTTGDVILKLVNPAPNARELRVQLDGAGRVSPRALALVLSGNKLSEENSFSEPQRVAPRVVARQIGSSNFNETVPAYSFVVLRVAAPAH